jgi:hypothetical protein
VALLRPFHDPGFDQSLDISESTELAVFFSKREATSCTHRSRDGADLKTTKNTREDVMHYGPHQLSKPVLKNLFFFGE